MKPKEDFCHFKIPIFFFQIFESGDVDCPEKEESVDLEKEEEAVEAVEVVEEAMEVVEEEAVVIVEQRTVFFFLALNKFSPLY